MRARTRAMVSGPRPWGRTLPHCSCTVTAAHPANPHIEPREKPIMSTTNKQSAENAAPLESANTVAAQAADAVKTATAQAEGAIEASVEQIRELNEQAIKAGRAAGQRALDAYQACLL